jgi:pimeloyl-ACP methyl ester carboxylesterase
MSEAEHPAGAHLVRVGSLSLRCSVTGTEGRPLLLLNGLGANIEMWTSFRRSLGCRRTIAFDAPGTGSSSTPFRPLTMRELGAVAVGLLDALHYDDVDVLGYSFGGSIAQEMARDAPTRVHRLVLAASSCGWGAVPGDPFALLAMVTPARYYFGPAMAAVNALFGGNTLSDFATADAARQHRPPDPVGYCWQLLAALGWSSLPWLDRIRVPTLVLAAGGDRLVRASTARLLAQRIPDSRLVVVPGENHFFLLREDNDAAAQVVTAFLDEQHTKDQPVALACT